MRLSFPHLLSGNVGSIGVGNNVDLLNGVEVVSSILVKARFYSVVRSGKRE